MSHLAKHVQTLPGKGTVLLTLMEGDEIEIPFSWFTATPVCAPNFNDLEIVDDGQTIRLGDYEVLVEVVMKENRK